MIARICPKYLNSLVPVFKRHCYPLWAASRTLEKIGDTTQRYVSSGRFAIKTNLIKSVSSGAPSKRISLDVDGNFVTFDHMFLRDACSCPVCVDQSTQQKLFKTTDIPYDIYPKSIDTLGNGTVKIVWANDLPSLSSDKHESHFTAEFLRRYSSLRSRVRGRWNDRHAVLWNKRTMDKEVLWMDYGDYLSSNDALLRALRHLSSYGLMFLRGIPDNPDAVQAIAERVGTLKNTFYGSTWDVKSKKNSKNIAYTSLDLGLHMDLLYFESPPGLQFLHCIRNSTVGGTSIFADSFRAASDVRSKSRMLFRALTSFPVSFHYVNDGHHYHFVRPTVVLEENSYLAEKPISHINWAPPFQAAFEIDTGSDGSGRFRQYIKAAKEFSDSMEDCDSQFELRLQEGECVVFFNRRIVHSRRAFDPGSGDRWLKGTYVDIDAFYSRYRSLCGSSEREEDFYSYIV